MRIEKLTRLHAVEAFDCGDEALNRFLVRYAWQNQQSDNGATYVALDGDVIVGYYTLLVGGVEAGTTTIRVRKGLTRAPIPVMLLARLAVSKEQQGEGIGRGLLKDFLLRTVRVADLVGIRAVVVHAKDESARAYYERFDFEPSPTDPLHLFRLLKDIRAIVRA